MSTPDEVDLPRLTKQVGRALVRAAVDGWTLIRAEYRAAGRHIEVEVLIAGPDGRPLAVRPPAEVVEGLGRIREGMYRPGRGTWLRAVYEIEPPGAFTCDFEPDVEPVWRRVPPPIGFQDELRAHPRTDAHIPEWLRARAGLPPAPPPTPAEPPAAATLPPAAPVPSAPGPVPAPQHQAAPVPAPHRGSWPQPPGPPRPGGHQPGGPGQFPRPPGPRHAAPPPPPGAMPPWQQGPNTQQR